MEYKIDIEGVRDTINILRQVEPDLLKDLRKDIVNEPGLNEAVSSIRSRIPPVSPLLGNQFGYGGMVHNGRTSYRGAKVEAKFFPSVKLGARNEKSLVTIVTTPPKDGVGFEIIDMVGRGKNANTAKAAGMKKKLPGSPSRYVWKGFEEKKEGINRAITAIIGRYSEKVNVKLKVR